MSNEILEEQQEQAQHARIAAALGISVDELDSLEWRLESHESDDGVFYGYNIHFGEGSDPTILSKIRGLIDSRWVHLGPAL